MLSELNKYIGVLLTSISHGLCLLGYYLIVYAIVGALLGCLWYCWGIT